MVMIQDLQKTIEVFDIDKPYYDFRTGMYDNADLGFQVRCGKCGCYNFDNLNNVVETDLLLNREIRIIYQENEIICRGCKRKYALVFNNNYMPIFLSQSKNKKRDLLVFIKIIKK
jgi:hypothetical protein